jgi:methyl-accepting chemotaxis protein
MGRLGTAAEALAAGRLDVEFEPRSAEDRLGQSFTTMLANLRDIVRSLQAAATAMESSSSELGQLSSGLRSVADENGEQGDVGLGFGRGDAKLHQRDRAETPAAWRMSHGRPCVLSSVTSTAMTEMKVSSQEISQVTDLIAKHRRTDEPPGVECDDRGGARGGKPAAGSPSSPARSSPLAVETGSATSRITETVTAVQQRACEASDSIASVSQVIDEVDSIASSIASAVEQQSVTTQEIARNISDVACAAERTQRATEQAEHAARAVADLARDLRGIASRFHLTAAK